MSYFGGMFGGNNGGGLLGGAPGQTASAFSPGGSQSPAGISPQLLALLAAFQSRGGMPGQGGGPMAGGAPQLPAPVQSPGGIGGPPGGLGGVQPGGMPQGAASMPGGGPNLIQQLLALNPQLLQQLFRGGAGGPGGLNPAGGQVSNATTGNQDFWGGSAPPIR